MSVTAIISIVLLLAACSLSIVNQQAGTDSGQAEYPVNGTASSDDSLPAKPVIVFAAASLTDAFQEIGKEYEITHPGTKVDFSFAGSQVLRTQIEQGAVADVFASADQHNMDILIAEKRVATNNIKVFAQNRLVVALPFDNPANVQSLMDLSQPNLKLILADVSVPAGEYARQVLSKLSQDPIYGKDFSAKVLKNVVSNETDVRQVVTKVELGEADAGIVYSSDVIASSSLATLTIPDRYNITVEYPFALLSHSPNPEQGKAFIAYVTSPEGQSILQKWGFLPMQQP